MVPLLVVLAVLTVVPLLLSSSIGKSYVDRLLHRRNGSDLCAFGFGGGVGGLLLEEEEVDD